MFLFFYLIIYLCIYFSFTRVANESDFCKYNVWNQPTNKQISNRMKTKQANLHNIAKTYQEAV